MSKPRSISIRQSDLYIIAAIRIALAQLGIHPKPFSYVNIEGNKDQGEVTVETYEFHATVRFHGKGEVFYSIDSIEFDVLEEKHLAQPITVRFVNFAGSGVNLASIFTHNTDHRENVVYHLVGLSMGFDIAASVQHFLWEYPEVAIEGEDFKLTYNLSINGGRTEVCGISQIELWYHRTHGYTKARINGARHFVCNELTYVWTETK